MSKSIKGRKPSTPSHGLGDTESVIDAYISDEKNGVIQSVQRQLNALDKKAAALKEWRDKIPALREVVEFNTFEGMIGGYLTVGLGERPAAPGPERDAWVKRLVAIRAVVGPLREAYKGVENVEDAEKGLITVTLRPVGCGLDWSFRYKAKLPANAKCKIKKYVSYGMVCEG